MTTQVDLKVVLLGKEFSGKTSLAERYLHGRFLGQRSYQATIGAAFGAKKIDFEEGKCLKLGLWDTAGSERYESMSRIYYRGAWAAVVCYELTDKKSFERAKFWINEVRNNEEKCRIYLCGTKVDLVADENKRKRQVDYHDVVDYASEGIPGTVAKVFETSSKTGQNVAELFRTIAVDFMEEKSKTQTVPKSASDDKVNLENTHKKVKCCS